MHVEDLIELYEYNYWANRKLLAVVETLTPEQFTRPIAGSYESVRNTLVHVVSAEWGWMDRCGGPPRGEKLKSEDYPTCEPLIRLWSQVERDMRKFLAGLTDADLARPIEFAFGGPRMGAPLGELLRHGALHAVHHRGQVSMLLRMIGVAPGNFDLLFHAVERASSQRAL